MCITKHSCQKVVTYIVYTSSIGLQVHQVLECVFIDTWGVLIIFVECHHWSPCAYVKLFNILTHGHLSVKQATTSQQHEILFVEVAFSHFHHCSPKPSDQLRTESKCTLPIYPSHGVHQHLVSILHSSPTSCPCSLSGTSKSTWIHWPLNKWKISTISFDLFTIPTTPPSQFTPTWPFTPLRQFVYHPQPFMCCPYLFVCPLSPMHYLMLTLLCQQWCV